MDVALGFAMLAAIVAIYFLPTIVAGSRHVPSAGSVFVINLFFGWTLIGWVVALAMACRTVPQAHLDELQTRRDAHQARQAEIKRGWENAKTEPVRPSWWR